MNHSLKRFLQGAALVASVIAIPARASADTTVIVESDSRGPTLVGSGLVTFGIAYGAAVIVGATSAHPGDQRLFVPIAGPWLDIAERGPCGPAESRTCDNETVNKVLLGVDGVFQAIGALQIVGAFLMPETRTVTTVPATAFTPEMHVTPAKMGYEGYGLAAFATF